MKRSVRVALAVLALLIAAGCLPVLADGDEAILFIYTRNDTHVLTGFQQGSFKVVRDGLGRKVTNRAIPSVQASITNTWTVDSLISEIMAAAE